MRIAAVPYQRAHILAFLHQTADLYLRIEQRDGNSEMVGNGAYNACHTLRSEYTHVNIHTIKFAFVQREEIMQFVGIVVYHHRRNETIVLVWQNRI